MNPQPTTVKLALVGTEATMSLVGPFGCVPEVIRTAACALNGWSQTTANSNEREEIDITIDEVQAIFFWIDADVCDWIKNELPGLIAARRMVEQWFSEGGVS